MHTSKVQRRPCVEVSPICVPASQPPVSMLSLAVRLPSGALVPLTVPPHTRFSTIKQQLQVWKRGKWETLLEMAQLRIRMTFLPSSCVVLAQRQGGVSADAQLKLEDTVLDDDVTPEMMGLGAGSGRGKQCGELLCRIPLPLVLRSPLPHSAALPFLSQWTSRHCPRGRRRAHFRAGGPARWRS